MLRCFTCITALVFCVHMAFFVVKFPASRCWFPVPGEDWCGRGGAEDSSQRAGGLCFTGGLTGQNGVGAVQSETTEDARDWVSSHAAMCFCVSVHFCFAQKSLSFFFFFFYSFTLTGCFLVKGNPGGWSLWTLRRGRRQENRSSSRDMRRANQTTNSTQRRRCGRNCRYVSVRYCYLVFFPLQYSNFNI